MAEVLDLRQFRSSQLESLLAAESVEWSRLLDWDYASSAELIRQYIDARILPGYVLAERMRGRMHPQGYGFFIYEARKGMIGNLFVHPEHRDLHSSLERVLLRHILDTLRATPGLERIEAQLMVFPREALRSSFAGEGFETFARVFLRLPLDREGNAAPARNHSRSGLRIEPWGGASLEEAARLIQHAYQHHVDARINDQYRTYAGAVRFMHNIAHYPGCGVFDPDSSFIARSLPQAGLEGMILASRVKNDVAHITQICVSPERQHQGLGGALLERCLTTLRQQRLRAATLTVTAANSAACSLYRQLGFVTLTEFDAHVWEPARPASSEGL